MAFLQGVSCSPACEAMTLGGHRGPHEVLFKHRNGLLEPPIASWDKGCIIWVSMREIIPWRAGSREILEMPNYHRLGCSQVYQNWKTFKEEKALLNKLGHDGDSVLSPVHWAWYNCTHKKKGTNSEGTLARRGYFNGFVESHERM